MNAGELVPYNTAEQMAAEYRDATAKIREAVNVLGEQCERLQTAFLCDGRYDRFTFAIELLYGSDSRSQTIDAILQKMKLAAWGAIIERLNIRRLMSSKRIAQLNEALGNGSGRGYYRGDGEERTEFPDITPENIVAVASGMVSSANEFLEEAVAEEYDHWRPRYTDEYKTNRNGFYKLTPKLIKGYTVQSGYGAKGYRCNYDAERHVTALDNIFHMLDGKGPVKE